ncbi:hypothetical protein ACWDRB_47195 [Nonomuraea sp. NPDC003707]
MTIASPFAFVPRLLAVVLSPNSTGPTAHSSECPAYDWFIPAQSGEPGDWSGSVEDLSTLTMRWRNVILHPCLAKTARAYGIPAGLDHNDARGRWLRADVLMGYVLDTDEPTTPEPYAPAVANVRRQVHIHAAAPFVRGSYARLERVVHALADQLGHGEVDASYVIHTLRDRPEAVAW